MKLSKREIIMLTILFIIAVIFIEASLIITPGLDNISKLTAQEAELKMQVDEINLNLISIDALTEKRDNNLAEINALSTPFIDGLNSDVLLLYVHDLLQANQFAPEGYGVTTVVPTVLSPRAIEVVNLSYQISDLALEYQKLQNPEPAEPGEDILPPETAGEGSVEQLSLNITAIGRYEQVLGLIDQIQNKQRTIAISNLNLYYLDVDQLQVEMTLRFIGINKIEHIADDLTEWTRPAYDGGSANPYNAIIVPPVLPEISTIPTLIE